MVFRFYNFGAVLGTEFERDVYSYWPGPGFADNFYSKDQCCCVHLFALGTENAETMQIKLIIKSIRFYKQDYQCIEL